MSLKKKKTDRKGRVSPLENQIKATLSAIAARQRNVHPVIWPNWSIIVGKALAYKATPVRLYNKILTVQVKSSSWVQELTFIKDKMSGQIEKAVGKGVVKDIKFVVGN